ncbi:MAG: flavin-containing monooxygenase [Thermomicrobiales bacterium]
MDYDAIVIGAGFAGLYALKRLRDDLGLRTHLYEQGQGVGGTWFWNKYPGAMSDTRSHLYCYSFDRDVLKTNNFAQHYRLQPEILDYLENFAKRYDLMQDISLGVEVAGAVWDAKADCWQIELAGGKKVSARFVVTALGLLSMPKMPAIEGIETFTGEMVHTSRWPQDATWSGKRVGIIGTGSTGVQVITAIAPGVEHLTVFQRSPQYSVPSGNGYMSEDHIRQIKENYEDIWNLEKETITVFGAKESNISAHDVTAEERERIFEEAWADGGGFRFMFGTFNDLIFDEQANRYAQDFIRSKIRQIVKDPKKAETLMPKDLYAKRPLCDAGYYQQFNRDNVDVVDVRANPIARVEGNAVILEDGERHELDMLILATGFDAGDGNYLRIRLEGVDGIAIQDQWKDGARTFLGIMADNFPNMFMVNAPGVPFANQPPAIELQVDMIAELIAETRDRDATAIEAKESAVTMWFDTCMDLTRGTLLPKSQSWILGANIPGKPLSLNFYMGGYSKYKGVLQDVRSDGYSQFSFHHHG